MKQNGKIGYLMVLIAGIMWGSIGFFVHILSTQGAQSSTIAFLRIFNGGLILIPIIFLISKVSLFKIDRKSLLVCIVLGIFCQGIFNFSYNESISSVGVATAAVMLYTSPIFVCIMSRIFFKEKIGHFKVAALLINITGCVLTVTSGDFTAIHFSVYGVFTGIMAGFLYASMTIISKTAIKECHPLTIMFYSFMFGSIFIAIISHPWINITEIADSHFLLSAIGYGLFATVCPYCFYLKGLSMDIETSKVPVIASIETVVAAIIGITVFHEASCLFKLIGISLVILSIALMNL